MKAKRWFMWTLLAMVVVLCASVLVWHGQRATAQGKAPSLASPPGGQSRAVPAAGTDRGAAPSLADPMGEQGEAAPAAPVPGGPGFYSVGAYNFSPYYAYQHDQWARSGTMLYNPGSNSAVYDQVLALPQGATVSKFVAYFYDNDPGADLYIWLGRCPLDDMYCYTMAGVSSSGADPGYRFVEVTSISSPVIDNQSNMYIAELLLPASPSGALAIIGIRVDYAYAAELPLVMRGQ